MKDFWRALKRYFIRLDKWLLFFCVAASGFGCLLLYSELQQGFISSSASRLGNSFTIQIVATILGVTAALIVSAIDYKFLAKVWFLHLPVTLGLVLLTFTNLSIVYTPPGSDDSAWLRVGGLSLQPSELLKFSFILTFALHLSKVKENDGMNSLPKILLLCLHGAFPCLLIFIQGDMGSALVFFFIFLCMIFTAGLPYKYVAVGVGGMVLLGAVIWFGGFIPDYLMERITILSDLESDPMGAGYQQLIGRRILGSGEVFGKGLFSDDLNWVYALESDFVLANVGQTLGFVGCVAVLALLTVICVKLLLNARNAPDRLGCYICVGVFAMIFFQMLINVGMVLCILPVVGITLPFISSGGTSLVTSFLSIGLAMNVFYRRKNR